MILLLLEPLTVKYLCDMVLATSKWHIAQSFGEQLFCKNSITVTANYSTPGHLIGCVSTMIALIYKVGIFISGIKGLEKLLHCLYIIKAYFFSGVFCLLLGLYGG